MVNGYLYLLIDANLPSFLNTEDLQLPQTKNETPATVEPNATASTPATVESDPTASTPTQPSTRSGRKVHLPTSYTRAFGDGPRNFEPWSSDVDDTWVGTPLLTTTPHQREDVSALDRFNVHRCPTRRVFSGTGLEPVTKQAMVRYLYHSATVATSIGGNSRVKKNQIRISNPFNKFSTIP
ncbi:uncharacterized protein TNCV_4302211 [Trichonephila clavipes]|nr:uncharacterized protein TNCV_4302211 [Trichonephila clavipes]